MRRVIRASVLRRLAPALLLLLAEAVPLAPARAQFLSGGPPPVVSSPAAEPLSPQVFETRRGRLVRNMSQALRSGDLAAAEGKMQAMIALYSEAFGPTAPQTLEAIGNGARILEEFGGGSPALRQLLYERSETALGPLHPATLDALDWLVTYLMAASAPEFGPLVRKSVVGNRQVFGPDAPQTRKAEINLADLLIEEGDLQAARGLLEDLAARYRNAPGGDRTWPGLVLMQLGEVRFELGTFEEALATLDQAAVFIRSAGGLDDVALGSIDHLRAKSLLQLGRAAEAETVLRGALDRAGRTESADPSLHSTLLFSLARALMEQGRQDEARAVAEDAMTATLKVKLSDPAAQIEMLERNAQDLGDLDRPEFEIEARRVALAQATALYGKAAAETGAIMSRLGEALLMNGDYDEGRRLMEAGLAGLERGLGPEDPASLRARHRLALVWMNEGRFREALEAQQQYLLHLRQTLGPDALDTVNAQIELAQFLQVAGLPAKADPLLKDALVRLGERTEADDLRHAINRARADGLLQQDRPAEALALLQAERSYEIDAFRQKSADVFVPGMKQTHRNGIGHYGLLLAQTAWLTTGNSGDVARVAGLRAAAFEAAQLAASEETSDAAARAAARDGVRDPNLKLALAEMERLRAESVRLRQGRLDRLDNGAFRLEAGYDSVQALATLEAELRRDHPELMGLMMPQPTPLARLQGADGGAALLREDEVLVLIAGTRSTVHNPKMNFSLVWAVTRDAVVWAAIPFNEYALVDEIKRLRDQLDPQSEAAASFDLASVRAPVRPDGVGGGVGAAQTTQRPFDIPAAHDLYQAFFGDPAIAAVLADKPNWVIVGQESAIDLPFGALVSRLPPPETKGAARLRATGWLGLDRALLTLPSVSAFAALRERMEEDKVGRQSYVGFGDPDFGAGSPLPRLAGTREEVLRIAGLEGIEPLGLQIAAEASEAQLAGLAARGVIETADILHFATHGVMTRASDTAQPEPALALAHPVGTRSGDGAPGLVEDGFLKAPEIASLRLSADWVLLSACNTAARVGYGVQGLQGLTDAFIDAGARNVLVSHWRVQDEVAARLVVDTVAGKLKGLPKAEALRQAMRAVAADTSRDRTELPNAHPSVWAPFLLVGNG